MDIDNMTPDELRRRLRDALEELEQMKRRLAGEGTSNEYVLTKTGAGYRIVELWKVPS
jgi:hypothetical protein